MAWAYDEKMEVLGHAQNTASVSHDHPEGINGAQAVAYAIWYVRTFGYQKDELFKNLGKFYPGWQRKQYPQGVFDETCQGTVPVAFQIIKGSYSFEDAIRNAVSIGGDSDTIAAIAGSIAEAAYGIPERIREKAWDRLDEPLQDVLIRWEKFIG